MRKIEDYEEMILGYCEANPMIMAYQDVLRKNEVAQKTPEYKQQGYTFKYGTYNVANYLLAE